MAAYEDQLRDLANTDQGGYFGGTSALEEMLAISKQRSDANAQTVSAAAYGEPIASPQSPNAARLITNIPELRSQASTYIEPPTAATLQANAIPKSGMEAFLSSYEKRLAETPDFQGKQSILNELRDSAMQRMGAAQQAAQATVENSMNLGPIRKALNKAVELDRRNAALEGLDSPETAKLRATVLKMEEEARKTTQDILKNNPDMQRFAKSVDSTVSQHERMAEKAFNDAVKLAEKKDAEREAAKAGVAMLDPAAREAITRINPAMKDDVEYFKFIQQGGGKNKDWAPILLGEIKDTNYVQAALQDKNLPARMLAINEESLRTNRDPREVDEEMKKLETLSKNPAMAMEVMSKAGLFDGPDGKKKLADIKSKLTIGDATTRKETNALLISMLPDLSKRNAIVESRNIPSQELMSVPGFAETYQLTSQKKGAPANIQEAGMAWMREEGISNEERINRQEQITQAYAQEVARRGKSGIFFQMDQSQVAEEARKMQSSLTANTVRETFLRKAGALIGRTAEMANENNFLAQMFNMQEQGLKAQYGLLDEFVSGMTGGNK